MANVISDSNMQSTTLNNTPNAERFCVALFGKCNSGKSSLLNAIVGQPVSIVSDVAGTTTDPVSKAMELPEVGASLLIDTPGLDDNTALGKERVQRTHEAMAKADVAVVLFAAESSEVELKLIKELKDRDIPTIAVISKCDTIEDIKGLSEQISNTTGLNPIPTSATLGEGIEQLRSAIATHHKSEERLITEGFCQSGDLVMLVMPQDAQAPQGRLIKPQAQTLRELLERGCMAICCTAEQMADALASLSQPPKLIITDSQAFDKVYALKPESSILTSFSILFARYKGDIDEFVAGAKAIQNLTSSSRVLIAEACAHAPKSEDIGRVKLPRLLRRKAGEELKIDIVAGNEFPTDLTPYDVVIHCGACMFNRRHVLSRIAQAKAQGVPITNYGVTIAALQGILGKVKTDA